MHFYSNVFTSNGIKYVKEGGRGQGREYPKGSGIKLKRVPFLNGIDISGYDDNDYDDPE